MRGVLHVRRCHFLGSDLLTAVRRIELRRAEARAAGQEPPAPEPRATRLREQGRAAGLLGRRRMVTLDVMLPVDLIERLLWLTGARTVQEVVELALLNMILRSGWRQIPRRRPFYSRQHRPPMGAHAGQISRVQGR